MPSLAFRIAAHESGSGIGDAIVKATGSPYCHVELWLTGDIKQARCFSSRIPNGCDWETIDLSDEAVWKIVPLDDDIAFAVPAAIWFCNGSIGQAYDYAGIIGIGMDTSMHDPTRRFCSEKVFEVGQWCFGWRKDIPRWHVAPGWTKGGDRHGLYEMTISGELTPR